MRYAELNPVRAGMVEEAVDWPWSSAAVHCGIAEPNIDLEMARWRRQWSEASWRKFLDEGESEAGLRGIRRSTQTGRPLGPDQFIRTLEERSERRLTPRRPGRPRKPIAPSPEQLVPGCPLVYDDGRDPTKRRGMAARNTMREIRGLPNGFAAGRDFSMGMQTAENSL